MSDERPLPPPDEERIRELLGDLPAENADPAFRARLREQFLQGTGRSVRFTRFRILIAAAAAAALVLVVSLLNQGPSWHVVIEDADAAASIKVHIGDTTYTAVDLQNTPSLLAAGQAVHTVDDSEMVLQAGDLMVWVLTPCTEVDLPETPGRWFGRNAITEVRSGELRVSTLPGFKGARLTIANDLTRIELVGSTIAVIQNDLGTCVCVLEGDVTMLDRGQDTPVKVPAGKRRQVFKDGRTLVEDLLDMERSKLQMLRDQVSGN